MKDVASLHKEEYGNSPQIVVAAPGVVNIMGEHTEHTGGFALPFAINKYIHLAVSLRKDNSLRFFAADLNERKRTSIANIKYKREDRWANYLKGVIAAFLENGFSMKGLDVTLLGDIPPGIGLASSAALTVAAASAIKNLFGFSLADRKIVEIARKAERDFMKIETGVIDAVTSFFGKKGNALFLDTKSLDFRYVPISIKDVKFLVTDSRVPHTMGDSEFTQRWADCEKCIELLSKRRPNTTLRDYTPRDIRESMGILPENIRRRCLHVVEENARVKEAEDILRKNGNVVALGKLLNRSHESLRDLFEVSCPELDWLVKRSWETEGVLGSRLTGVGFGGCTITLIRTDAIPEYEKRLEEYERIFGFKAVSFICEASNGVRVL